MFDEELMATWKRAEAGGPPLSRGAIEDLLRPMVRWSGRALEAVAWIYLVLMACAAVLAVVNLPGYRGNPVMTTFEAGLALVSAACGTFSAWLAVSLRRIGRADLPLVETVERRMQFYDRWMGPWMIVGAATPWLLSMAINTLIDNQGGEYRVNHPWEFALVTAVMFGFTYVALRVSLMPSVRAAQAVLLDLRAEAIGATPEIASMRRRTRVWMALAVVLLVLGVLAGLWMWWKGTG